jgi:hypothetical protein
MKALADNLILNVDQNRAYVGVRRRKAKTLLSKLQSSAEIFLIQL